MEAATYKNNIFFSVSGIHADTFSKVGKLNARRRSSTIGPPKPEIRGNCKPFEKTRKLLTQGEHSNLKIRTTGDPSTNLKPDTTYEPYEISNFFDPKMLANSGLLSF